MLELHLQRDPEQTVKLLQKIHHAGYSLRCVNYEGDIVETDMFTITAKPQEHWTLWLRR